MILEEVIGQLSDIITNELHFGEGIQMNAETKLLEIGMDSIALMSLIVFIEEHFGFEAGEEAFFDDKFVCLGDVAEYILSKIQK